jgi:hypothetical protein
MRRLLAFAACLVVAVGLSGCTQAASRLTDGREVLARALDSTAALRTVRVTLTVTFDMGGHPSTVTAEGDVDVQARELDLAVEMDPPPFDTGSARAVIVDGTIFTRTGSDSWSVSGGPGEDPLRDLPTTAILAGAIKAAILDTRTDVAMGDPEACGDADCYRVQARVPPEVAWQALLPMSGPAATPPPVPAQLRTFAIDVWVEEGTFRLREARNTTVIDSQTFQIGIRLERHDEPVSIEPPIPDPN